jgi:hypothetical protein
MLAFHHGMVVTGVPDQGDGIPVMRYYRYIHSRVPSYGLVCELAWKQSHLLHQPIYPYKLKQG